ncbi:MAG: hypothetical protein PF495_09200 [Spirochaetales bacterium]|jgi:hypothetical protein|nr:hypothetical protein [Spirochaetales bacterium]
MSKKFVLVLLAIMLAVPASVFAVDLIGLRIGPAAMIGGKLEEIQKPGFFKDLDSSNFTFGADARLNFSLLEVNALALYTPEGEVDPATVDLYANAGASLSLLNILRLGVSAGPKVTILVGEENDMSEEDPLDMALNLRLSGDVELGDLSIGASAIFPTTYTLKMATDGDPLPKDIFDEGLFGVSVLFALF